MMKDLKERAKKAAVSAGSAAGSEVMKSTMFYAKLGKATILGKEEKPTTPDPNAKKEVISSPKEKVISQSDLVQPLETGAPLKIKIVSAASLAKAAMFGKSDPVAVVFFMDKEIASTPVCDNTMDPVWYPDPAASFTLTLPTRLKKPLLTVKVFDSDAPALLSSAGIGASKLGDFLGQITLEGEDVLHPKPLEYQIDLTPPNPTTPLPTVHGQVYTLQPDQSRNAKYNKLVQGTISIHIDRSLVDKQIADKEASKLKKDLQRQLENEALLNLPPPSAIVMNERANTEGGLWVPKRFAELKKGDERHHLNYLEGNVELRALRQLYKLSFSECRVVSRFKEAEEPSDSDNDDDMTIEQVQKKRIRLSLYMSHKKPKKRMADIEETGHLVQCDTNDGFVDALLGKHSKLTTFDVSLKDCPDPGDYTGCVIVKRKSEPPLTDEPVVFGFARFSKSAKELVGTELALGMTANKKAPGEEKKEKSAMQGLNSVSYYSRLAKNAWSFLEITEEEEINYKQFKKALDLLNIIILEGRALRIFKKCDLPDESGVPSGKLSMTEFEVALMMNDAVPKAGADLTPLDSFYIFDVDGSGQINQTEFSEVVRALGQSRSDEELLEIFDKADRDKSGVIDYKEFKKIWCSTLVDAEAELVKLNIEPYRMSDDGLMSKIKVGPFVKMRTQALQAMNSNVLLKYIERNDAFMLEQFDTVQDKVKKVRIEAQHRKDERKRAAKAVQAIHSREAAKDAAFRDKEKRQQIQKDQKERAKQRIQEKLMQEKMAAEQARAKQREKELISMNRKQKEEFRIKEIRRKGEDKLIRKDMGYRVIPLDLYQSADAQAKLANLKVMDLSGNKLVELPDSNFLFNLNALRSLNLSHNRLMRFPAEISNCGNLEIWIIDNNDLRELPKEIQFMNEMVHWDFSRNRIQIIPKEIENMHPLKYFVAHSNIIEDVGEGFGELAQLEYCDLSSNKLRQLPEEFSNLTSLVKLNLSNNLITHLPDFFGSLYQVEQIDLSANQIQVLPESMVGMEKLEIIKLNDNWIQEIPSCVKGWVSCMDLQIRNNRVRRISEHIGGMISLQSLDMPVNQLEVMPPEIGMLTTLSELNMRTNRLKCFPPEIGALVSLQTFDVSYNQLDEELPPEFGLLRAMRKLNLSHNKLQGLPMSFGALECLEELNMSHNCLPAVPQSMMYLQGVWRFNCSGNQITSFPIHLCDLIKLRDLDLSSNCLTFLPTSVDMFTALERLDLHHNLLKALPLEFATLVDEVKELSVIQNPFTYFPEKWNYRWTEKEMYQNPSGYSNQEVFEYIKDEALYFRCAEAEWAETGALHYENRLSFDEFVYGNTKESKVDEDFLVTGVAERMGKVPVYDKDGIYVIGYEMRWHPRFLEHLKVFYFTAKEYGMSPVYDELSGEEMQKRAEMAEKGRLKREAIAQKAIDADKAMRLKMQEAYHQDLDQKTRRAEGAGLDRKIRAQHVGVCTNDTLMLEIQRRAELQEITKKGLERKRMQDAKDEMARLQGFVNANVSKAAIEGIKRTCPIDIVPCWKSKAISNESLPDHRPGAISFKKKFGKKERNYDVFGAGGRQLQDQRALDELGTG
jgi:Leucine-rich repeat (LRR) protein/Ca2+-binding EF-hand superfamily protein